MVTGKANFFFGRRAAWMALLSLALIGLAIVIIPVWIVQPFKPQTEAGLKISYALRRWSPLVTIIASAAALIFVIWLFPGARRWWRKAALVVIALPLLAATWFARQNHFEWMFHPLAQTAYAKTNDTGFVSDTDMVLAVENKGEAVAYPVRQMAYHHLVADVVGGTPIVATY
jgi:phosphoglycerol transferase MdoB-like AlkP superfamily enzyme